MKLPLITGFLYIITLRVLTIEAQTTVCQEEQNAVNDCFANQCADCNGLDLDVNVDETTQLEDLDNALSLDFSTAKDCCNGCSNQVDTLQNCVSPTICVNGECLGGDNNSGTLNTTGSQQLVMALTVGLVAGLLK